MPRLHNTQHEIFAHALSAGNDPLPSYVAAGYAVHEGAATALSRTPMIERRVAELASYYGVLARGKDDD